MAVSTPLDDSRGPSTSAGLEEEVLHATTLCRFALLVRNRCSKLRFKGKKIELRIGIHSGSCVSGIVGKVMPRYCFFGTTINLANRYESSGEQTKIHISSETASLIRSNAAFHITKRTEQVVLKGVKDPVTSFWLDEEGGGESSCEYNEVV